MATPCLEFPKSLWEKYAPETLDQFIGLDRAKAVFGSFVRKPFASAWLLLGPSGTGKTTMGLAVAKTLKAELHHVPSRSCDLETVENLAHLCQYVPLSGGFHLILVDEADQMTPAAQLAFLSKLDATAFPPNTIFIFTANDTRLLEQRFLSRLRLVEFGTQGIEAGLVSYLKAIWNQETGRRNGVDLKAICESSEGNVRDALMKLEVEILAHGIAAEPKAERRWKPEAKTIYQERAAKAVATREARIREKVLAEGVGSCK